MRGRVRGAESYPIFQGVTLDFLTFSTTARPTGIRHKRDIYHPVEKKKSYRLIYDTDMCGDRGGRGGDMRPWVDFGNESAVICIDIVPVGSGGAGLFGRLFCRASGRGEGATVG